MNRLIGVARFLVGFLGAISLIGLVWFGASLSGTMIAAGMVLVLTSAIVAAVPAALSDRGPRLAMILVCSLGIVALVAMSVDQLAKSRAIEWDVEIMRALHIVAFGLIAAGLVTSGDKHG